MQDVKPVVALDIDGTLGDYHDHFLRFAHAFLAREEPMWVWLNYTGAVPLYRHMHVSKTTYRQVKLAYRQGGLKRSMPVWDGAPELTRSLRTKGFDVWLCTTRPYLRLDNIDPDTRFWLRRHRFQYDGMLYGQRKYYDLVKIVGRDRVLAVLDDEREQVVRARALDLPTFFRRNRANQVVEGVEGAYDMWGLTETSYDTFLDYCLKAARRIRA